MYHFNVLFASKSKTAYQIFSPYIRSESCFVFRIDPRILATHPLMLFIALSAALTYLIRGLFFFIQV